MLRFKTLLRQRSSLCDVHNVHDVHFWYDRDMKREGSSKDRRELPVIIN